LANIKALTCNSYLAGDETRPSNNVFSKLISPTDFDFVYDTMYDRIRLKQGVLSYKYFGPMNNLLKLFLLYYIEVSSMESKSYSNTEKSWWVGKLKIASGTTFTGEQLLEFVETFNQLIHENKIPKTILQPYNYVPEKQSLIEATREAISKATGFSFIRVVVVVGIAVGAYAFLSGGYLKLLPKAKQWVKA
jgi:hypothetical protein